MNSDPARTGDKAASPTLPSWPRALEAWRRLLAECEQKATRKRVHALRVATLRLQAQFKHWLDRHDASHPATQAVTQWNKQAKHLRRALGAVRNCDIYAAKLAGIRATLITTTGYEPRTSRTSLQQIAELERHIKRDRRTSARKLSEMFDQRRERVAAAIGGIESELSSQEQLVPQMEFHALSSMSDEAVARFPKLSAESLHDFRREIKNVRYLAELMSENDLQIAELAAELKIVQGSIGEWHDWDELAREASQTFGRGTKESGLVELLETMAQEALERALELCESFRARLDSEDEAPVQRKPVRRASPMTTAAADVLCA